VEDELYGAEMEGFLEVFNEKLEELPSDSQVVKPSVSAKSAGIIAAMRCAMA
jgi:hypothetical protein